MYLLLIRKLASTKIFVVKSHEQKAFKLNRDEQIKFSTGIIISASTNVVISEPRSCDVINKHAQRRSQMSTGSHHCLVIDTTKYKAITTRDSKYINT